jgi:hypothetical protein
MGELVPLSTDRAVWNDLHGNNLRDHGNTLRPPTPEEAGRINDRFDIEVHVGLHGMTPEDIAGNPNGLYGLPTQEEYDAAAGVVDTMQPGDILFIEGRGFNEQPAKPESPNDDQSLQADREEYKIHAWEYAKRLAESKGIQVAYADHDEYEEEASQNVAGGMYPYMLASPDADERALGERINQQRERKATNTVKDYALDLLPFEEELAKPGERKPKLVLLFGVGHQDNLRNSFAEMGLNATVNSLDYTNDMSERLEDKRRQAVLLHSMGRAASVLSGLVITPDMTQRYSQR